MICKQNVFHATNISSGAQMYTLVIILLAIDIVYRRIVHWW